MRLLCLLMLCLPAFAQTLYLGPELFTHPELQEFTFTKYPASTPTTVVMKVVPMKALLPEKLATDSLEFISTDGFKMIIPVKKLLRGEALLAIEEENKPWPIIPKKGVSGGPYYLVWKNPKRADISKEQWPYMISEIELKGDILQEYPKLKPKSGFTRKTHRGLELFIQNCFSCHSINQEGGNKMGPDLNEPMNPTQYWQRSAFLKLVRDPSLVRKWPAQQMPGFNKKDLSDKEINLIWDYLKSFKN